ncbi:hypothetical protein D9M68_669670 [compost metagenome]
MNRNGSSRQITLRNTALVSAAECSDVTGKYCSAVWLMTLLLRCWADCSCRCGKGARPLACGALVRCVRPFRVVDRGAKMQGGWRGANTVLFDPAFGHSERRSDVTASGQMGDLPVLGKQKRLPRRSAAGVGSAESVACGGAGGDRSRHGAGVTLRSRAHPGSPCGHWPWGRQRAGENFNITRWGDIQIVPSGSYGGVERLISMRPPPHP